jgi:putative FmdB family regulatory protein
VPIFEYACRACGREFEQLVRTGDTPACPACASQDLDKLLSAVAVKTEGTRQLGLRAAKKRDQRQQADQTRERIEYEANHDD